MLLLLAGVVGVPLTGGLIIPIGLGVWALIVLRKRNQRAYDEQRRRQAIEDDAVYGRRMRGY